MARRDAEQTGKYIVLAAIAGAFTLAVVGGAFWLMFRHPNESEQAKQAREQRQRDREYYDSLPPFDAEKDAKERQERKDLEEFADEYNAVTTTKERQAELKREYNRKHPDKPIK